MDTIEAHNGDHNFFNKISIKRDNHRSENNTLNSHENIDFSLILNENFNKTLNSNKEISTYNNKNNNTDLISIFSNESTTSFMAKQFITEVCSVPQKLYCPCCTEDFQMEFLLKDHLKIMHRRVFKQMELQEMNLMFSCGICNSKFISKFILFEHIVKNHNMIVCDFTNEKVTCRYCKYNTSNKKMLSNHVLNIHRSKLELMADYFSNKTNSDENVLIASPGLSDVFKKMNTNENNNTPKQSVEPKSILKSPKMEILGTDTIHKAKGKTVTRKLSARRTLRFNLPDSDGTDESPPLLKIKNSWLSLLKLKRRLFKKKKSNFATSTPISKIRSYKRMSILNMEKNFQCGYCKALYEDNATLLLHLQIFHKNNFKILQKKYWCGKCNAKFYRNKYLVLHNKFHHSVIQEH